jgi:hypothetical protein
LFILFGSATSDKKSEPAVAEPAAAKKPAAAGAEESSRPEDIPTVEDLPGMIGSEEEYARILRKPLIKPAEEKLVEEPPEVSESEVRYCEQYCVGSGSDWPHRPDPYHALHKFCTIFFHENFWSSGQKKLPV